MQFSDGYYGHHPMADYHNAMDSDSYAKDAPEGSVQLGIKDIGMSVPLGISAQNVAGVYSKIRMGAGKIELGFPGAVSGQRQAQTPGMYGKDQRQALRELAAINEVEFTTHSAYNMMGMTGQDQQGNFALTRARVAQHELQRAIDFAADVSGGGSVVVHTGEFERPLTDMDQMGDNLSRGEDGRLLFKKRITEAADAQFQLVDDRTGQVHQTVQKDRLVAQPVWKRAEEDHDGSYQKGEYDPRCGTTVRIKKGDYLDYEGNKIIDPLDPAHGRVPIYDEETGRFKTKYLSYDDFKEVAEEKNKLWLEKNGEEPDYYNKATQVEAFLHATLETNEGHSRGWALQYGRSAGDHIEVLKKLRSAKKFYEELDQSLPPEEKWKMMVSDHRFGRYVSEQFVPAETANPLVVIDRMIGEQQKEIEFARQASSSQEQQALDTAETRAHIVEPIKYIEKHSIRGYSEAAIHAMDRSEDPDNPVVVTMENIFPEKFGGHPEELKWLITKARESFIQLITKPKYIVTGEEAGEKQYEVADDEGRLKLNETINPFYKEGVSTAEAEKLAEKHIKATLDTGHANMWKKFWQPKQGQTPEQNDKDFQTWYLKQIESLAKDKMVGNVHLTDNFGYQDDHLAPGQGNVPIKEVVAMLKKHGYDKAITVEPGADASTDVSDFHGLMKTWKHFGSPVYGVGMRTGAQQNWSDVQYSYFGQNQPPHYLFGGYAPSNDWTLWSAVPME